MKMKPFFYFLALGAIAYFFLNNQPAMSADKTPSKMPEIPEGYEQISLGAGCFWCVEAVYNRLDGVKSAVSGYTGGFTENPTYEEVVKGTTGHAEVVHVVYDPKKISTSEILQWFWKAHDPTTLNRQGNDIGTQYRSAIYVYTDEQRRIAKESKADVQSDFKNPIVTEITTATKFYPAEVYHQDYYRINGKKNGYCRYVIAPKIKKLGLKDKEKVAE